MQADELVRAIRRRLLLSQRELAQRVSVSRATIERVETGRRGCSYEVIDTIVRETGFELVLMDEQGALLLPDPIHDRLRQRDGRRFPAHLEWKAMPDADWWGWFRIAWLSDDRSVPSHVFWRRTGPEYLAAWEALVARLRAMSADPSVEGDGESTTP